MSRTRMLVRSAVVVLAVDEKKNRISLSMKQVPKT